MDLFRTTSALHLFKYSHWKLETVSIERLGGKLGIALNRMANLRYLNLQPRNCFENVFNPRPRVSAAFPFNLTRFHCNYAGEKPYGLVEFLVSQPSIRHLRVQVYYHTKKLPLSTLPNLESLDGPANIINAFTPISRPIPRLTWRTSGDLFFTEFPDTPNTNLMALRLPTRHAPGLKRLPDLTPNLRYLQCIVHHETVCPITYIQK